MPIRNLKRKLYVTCGGLFFLLVFFFGWVLWISVQRAQVSTQCAVIGGTLGQYYCSRKHPAAEDFDTLVKNGFAAIPHDGKLIIKSPQGELLDVWGNPFTIRLTNASDGVHFEIRSRGLDGIENTSDDIIRRRVWTLPSVPDKTEKGLPCAPSR